MVCDCYHLTGYHCGGRCSACTHHPHWASSHAHCLAPTPHYHPPHHLHCSDGPYHGAPCHPHVHAHHKPCSCYRAALECQKQAAISNYRSMEKYHREISDSYRHMVEDVKRHHSF
ncbi:hypothetical protein TCAL_15589 [Tigriopus californicus]|uniref:Uncharacterized protein n=1 Tax=Tigriopus californicus TaxID=6832 RepID=A0A553PDN9_TIGCA|nr:hypothetical protein TCAL_15589 [Tigriopus californicus]